MTPTDFKKRYPRQFKKLIEFYSRDCRVFDFAGAIALYARSAPKPKCQVCNKFVSITKKFRQEGAAVRCSLHSNTNNIITRDIAKLAETALYKIAQLPDKILTQTDQITVTCQLHGDYIVGLGNFIKGMQCQRCYFDSKVGKPGVIHTAITKKKLAQAKTGKSVNLSDYVRQIKTEKQKAAWQRRKKDKVAYAEYINLLSRHRKQYIKENGNVFPKKEKTRLEINFEDFLIQHNISYIAQYIVGGKKFDFYLPIMLLLVEVDGEYWHRKPSSIKNDTEKHIICRNTNVELVRISTDNYIPEIIFESKETRRAHTMTILTNRGINGF